MHTTNQILDALSTKLGEASDYRLAKTLGASSTATVANWRSGRSSLSLDYAHKVAELLEWDAAYVVACVEAERARKDDRLEQTDEIAATWQRIADKFRPALPSILLAAVGLFTGQETHAVSMITQQSPQLLISDFLYYAHLRLGELELA